ncbi:hypothetical protein BCV70DRAFT_198670 [Testicularia cyperi]|uniref:Uncharacterized protein n=1 Tax=Testicularia cyperi TaxID=1882483 RepID=A0A317XWT8_9BASI|nr:hypothetical protein BCV70DRAFT_198670 [Testicularia cyperi]
MADRAPLLADLFSQSRLSIHLTAATDAKSPRDAAGAEQTLPSFVAPPTAALESQSASLSTPSPDSRSTVFFDELLRVVVRLEVPSGPSSIPAPAASRNNTNSTSQPTSTPTAWLPLQAGPWLADSASSLASRSIDGSIDAAGGARVPALLYALLACLHVSLVSDYVPHLNNSDATLPKSSNLYEPLASIQQRYANLQLLPPHRPPPSQQQQQQHNYPAQPSANLAASVRSFSLSWTGDRPPEKDKLDASSNSDVAKPKARANSASVADGDPADDDRSSIRFDSGTERWVVSWPCTVPVNFVATPFEPLLSLTAGLTLRLSPSMLDHLLASLSYGQSSRRGQQQHLRSGFQHSLLTPLHEGPIYPDESLSQSLARANASSALGLDGPNGLGSYLAHLPKCVLGGNNTLVTPNGGIDALREIEMRRRQALGLQDTDSVSPSSKPRRIVNGDLSQHPFAASTSTSTSASTSTSTSTGPTAPRDAAATTNPSSLQIYKRSTRRIFFLKSGLNVRMRTLFSHHLPAASASSSVDLVASLMNQHTHGHGYGDALDGAGTAGRNLQSTALILCVELENPFDAAFDFTVSDIKVKIHPPSGFASGAGGDGDGDKDGIGAVGAVPRIVARYLSPSPRAVGGSSAPTPITLQPGAQHNVLYCLSATAAASACMSGSEADTSVRNVTILVSGRPAAHAGTTTVSQTLGTRDVEVKQDFESQWNCVLDLGPVLASARKQAFITRPLVAASASASALTGSAAFSSGKPAPTGMGGPVAGSLEYSASALSRAFATSTLHHAGHGSIMHTPTPAQTQTQTHAQRDRVFSSSYDSALGSSSSGRGGSAGAGGGGYFRPHTQTQMHLGLGRPGSFSRAATPTPAATAAAAAAPTSMLRTESKSERPTSSADWRTQSLLAKSKARARAAVAAAAAAAAAHADASKNTANVAATANGSNGRSIPHPHTVSLAAWTSMHAQPHGRPPSMQSTASIASSTTAAATGGGGSGGGWDAPPASGAGGLVFLASVSTTFSPDAIQAPLVRPNVTSTMVVVGGGGGATGTGTGTGIPFNANASINVNANACANAGDTTTGGESTDIETGHLHFEPRARVPGHVRGRGQGRGRGHGATDTLVCTPDDIVTLRLEVLTRRASVDTASYLASYSGSSSGLGRSATGATGSKLVLRWGGVFAAPPASASAARPRPSSITGLPNASLPPVGCSAGQTQSGEGLIPLASNVVVELPSSPRGAADASTLVLLHLKPLGAHGLFRIPALQVCFDPPLDVPGVWESAGRGGGGDSVWLRDLGSVAVVASS